MAAKKKEKVLSEETQQRLANMRQMINLIAPQGNMGEMVKLNNQLHFDINEIESELKQ